MNENDFNERVPETQTEPDSPDFQSELTSLLNRYSRENASNTPDWILRDYLCGCLAVFNAGVKARDKWYGMSPGPGAAEAAKETSS